MRVAIAGGSLGGLFVGALLHREGHEVTIHERSPSGLEGRGAGLVAQEEVFTILSLLGREDAARAGVTAHERITLNREGRIVNRLGHPQTQISWDVLYMSVRSLLSGGCYRTGDLVTGAGNSQGGAWLGVGDGEMVDAELVIGADGIGSAVRRAIVGGYGSEPSYAGYVAWRFLIPENDMPTVAKDMLSERFAFYHMAGGQALGYLVAGPNGETEAGSRRYNCVWYRRVPDLAGLLVDRSGKGHRFSLARGQVPDVMVERLKHDASRLLPEAFSAIVEAEPEPFVQAIFDLEAPVMAEGRIALLGDAAFIARPHTAMGVAKAAGDAMALVDAVGRIPIDEALRSYTSTRARVGRSIVAYGRRLGESLG